MLRRHKIFFYPKIQALTSRITRRLWISSGKHEDFPLMAWPETSFSRPRLRSEDRRASRAATDQLGGPASRCRDYQTRFVTTRTLSLSRRARRKLARLDSPGLGRGRSGRPKPHRPLFGLGAQIAQRQVGSGSWLQLRRFACNRVRFVKLSFKPKNATEIVLSRECQWIRFHRLPGLLLGLVEFSEINNHSRQQIVRRRISG